MLSAVKTKKRERWRRRRRREENDVAVGEEKYEKASYMSSPWDN